ncbi:hypothetical protein EDE15_2690 [Edaphobacter aggregans]|uniref:Uncharacterized protein n=1 Tax=Edaphobacter aggregans TaxID=570835 RepID=A0A3R9QBC1_9BACT|nr:hypothetical protein EDE15_2690 [Edaphobacter aggregans]
MVVFRSCCFCRCLNASTIMDIAVSDAQKSSLGKFEYTSGKALSARC